MMNVWRLTRGYVFRFHRRWLFVLPLALAVTVVGEDPAVTSMSWLLDLSRTFLAMTTIFGTFFHSLEVTTVPASRRQIWMAQWLLATAGVTSAVFALRLVERVVDGALHGQALFSSAVVDLFGCVVVAASVVLVFRPGGSRPQSAPWLPAVAGCALWMTTPVWSTYARGLLAPGLTSPVGLGFAVVVAGLFTAGLLLGPRRLFVVRHRGQAERTVVRNSRAPAAGSWGTLDQEAPNAASGVSRWVRRTLAIAVSTVIVTLIVLSTLFAVIDVHSDGASLTFIQRLSGQDLTRSGEPLTMIGVFTLIWVSTVTAGMRFLRTQPISRVVIATTLTAGVLMSLGLATCLQVAAYRIGFGQWPAFNPQVTVGVLLAVALGKTVVLCLGRSWQIPVVVAAVLAANLLASLWISLPAFPAIVVGLAAVGFLIRVDVSLLTSRSSLYRLNAQPV